MCKNVNSTRKNADTDTADAAVNGEYVTTLTVPTKGAASTSTDDDEAPKRVRE